MVPPAVGASAQIVRTITQLDIDEFGVLSQDTNPMHQPHEFARRTRFKRPIAHGMFTASLISAVIGTKLPGPGAIYISQSLKFLKPVFPGDTITAKATVTNVRADKPVVTLRTQCTNDRGELVLDGEAVLLLEDLAV